MRHGPKRLKKAAGIRLDPKTGEWRPKFNKPSPDPQLAEKIRARYAEELAKPMPVEKPPFDWNRYQPLPGRVLLKVGAEIPVEKGVVIPESARINEEWLTVIAANGQFDFVIGDRVFVDKKSAPETDDREWRNQLCASQGPTYCGCVEVEHHGQPTRHLMIDHSPSVSALGSASENMRWIHDMNLTPDVGSLRKVRRFLWLPMPESRKATVRVGTGELVGAPRRPLKRDLWTRAYVCAVATHWLQHGDIVTTADLLRTAGKHDNILKHADEEDIATLCSAGLLCPNGQSEPTAATALKSP